MNIRTRHLGILTYAGLIALIVWKDLVTDPVHLIGLTAPIVVMAGADKLEAIIRNKSGKDSN